jgi:hypothetical protein
MKFVSECGLLVSYSGMIEISKQGYVLISSELVDLNDNSFLQQETFQSVCIKAIGKKG